MVAFWYIYLQAFSVFFSPLSPFHLLCTCTRPPCKGCQGSGRKHQHNAQGLFTKVRQGLGKLIRYPGATVRSCYQPSPEDPEPRRLMGGLHLLLPFCFQQRSISMRHQQRLQGPRRARSVCLFCGFPRCQFTRGRLRPSTECTATVLGNLLHAALSLSSGHLALADSLLLLAPGGSPTPC